MLSSAEKDGIINLTLKSIEVKCQSMKNIISLVFFLSMVENGLIFQLNCPVLQTINEEQSFSLNTSTECFKKILENLPCGIIT